MKVLADFGLCESNAICVEQCPEVFFVDENDFLQILVEEPSAEWREKVEDAVRLCPRQALSIVEE